MRCSQSGRSAQVLVVGLALLHVIALPNVRAESVGETEAVAVADLWITAELNLSRAKPTIGRQAKQRPALDRRTVLYLSEANVSTKADAVVTAYAVVYEGGGFAVVGADDRLSPIIAFDLTSSLEAVHSERSFTRVALMRTMAARAAWLREIAKRGESPSVHSEWQRLRRMAQGGRDGGGDNRAGSINVLWDTPHWDQDDWYNEEVVRHNGDIRDIPTGCVATAWAMLFRFHAWPPSGAGSRSYSDNGGDVQFDHSVNYASRTYNWNAMPLDDLTESNDEVAQLMYDCGVMVSMNYETDVSNAQVHHGRVDHFRYVGSEFDLWWPVNHENNLIASLRAGLPVVISINPFAFPPEGHILLVDGYRSSPGPYFHMNLGWGDEWGWYNFDAVADLSGTISASYPFCQPENWSYVDSGATPLVEYGWVRYPYRTLADAVANTPSGGRVLLRSGTYVGTTLSTPMRITTYEGPSTIVGP